MMHFIQTLLGWLHQHPHWAAFFAFLIACIESLAILGLFIPGSTLLAVIGGFIGTGILQPVPILISAILGAVLGDFFSYWLGYHFHEKIRQVWPFNKFKTLLNKGEAFFNKHGGKSVFLARFLGPLRPIIPLIAGILNLSTYRFLIANIASASLWAPGYILLGMGIGAGLLESVPRYATQIILALLLTFILLWVIYVFIRNKLSQYLKIFNKKLHERLEHIPSIFLRKLLMDFEQPQSHRQLFLATQFLISTALFFILFFLIIAHINLSAINVPLHRGFMASPSPLLNRMAMLVTQFGEKWVLFPLALLLFVYFILKNARRLAFYWLNLMMLTLVSFFIFKTLTHSIRPPEAASIYTDFSFPSGHVGLSLVFWGFLAYILAQGTLYKDWIYAGVIVITLSVAVSRLYLGMHWLTDVIGAALLGFSCLSSVIFFYRRKAVPFSMNKKFLFIATLSAFILFSAIYLY